MTMRSLRCLVVAASLSACSPSDTAWTVATSDTTTALAPASVDGSSTIDHERGRRIWNYRCYVCHGYSGDGRTLAGMLLAPPPRDFTRPEALALSARQLRAAIADGKPGTAMKPFRGILSADDIAAVAGFVRQEFIVARAVNTRYHTAENGWPDHERYRAAFPFARGDIALDMPWNQLDDEQRRGKRLFLGSCISCHDRARVDDAGAVWETRALSYPRDAYCSSCHDEPNGDGLRAGAQAPADHGASARHAPATADAGVASTYSLHDRPPVQTNATALERRGESLYQRNCAFCHAADGTAKSWIGRFLEPHPRDLTDAIAMRGMTRERLIDAIEGGLDGTSMPAWKSVLQRGEIEAVAAYVQRMFEPARDR